MQDKGPKTMSALTVMAIGIVGALAGASVESTLAAWWCGAGTAMAIQVAMSFLWPSTR